MSELLEIQIEERLNFAGFAYWRDSDGKGRVFWVLEEARLPVRGGSGHKLVISPSWGFPTESVLEQIKAKIVSHVQNEGRAPTIQPEVD